MTGDDPLSEGGIIVPSSATEPAKSDRPSAEPTPSPAARERTPAFLAVPVWLDRLAAWSWRLLVIGGFVLALLWTVSWIRLAVIPTLVAVVFASALRPVAKSAVRIGVPRAIAVTTIMLSVLLIVVSGLLYAGREAANELDRSTVQTEAVRVEIERWFRSEPFNLEQDQIDEAETALRRALAGGVRSWGSNSGRMVLTVSGGAVLGVILTFLFLKDGSIMWRWFLGRVSPLRRTSVDRAGRAAVDTMAGYLRSILIAGVIDALLIGALLLLLGVPLVLPLMVLTFLAALFPVVGAVVAGLAATVVALVTVGLEAALWMAAGTLVIQQIEGNVVLPMVAGHQISLHPAAILVALSAGGAVAGLAGAFLAVPILAGLVAATSSISADRQADLELPASFREPT